MDTRGLLFIPDISGFSRFVSETEIDHSRLIIQELLEVLISSNEMNLQISEIEGDAILFYKFGELPELNDLYLQVEKMFCDFHRSLMAYEQQRYCQCTACASAKELTLKVITHYGEFTEYNVRNFNKLIGKDIIVAHQLLKNDIPQHEYWLITDNIFGEGQLQTPVQWMTWDKSVKRTDTGEVPFHYTLLSKLRTAIAYQDVLPPALEGKIKVLSVEKEYDTDIITLFHASGDFRYRSRWQEGIKDVEIVNHFLPRIGMKCRVVLEKGEMFIYSNSYRYRDDRIEFSETDADSGNTTYYVLQRTGKRKTKFTLEFYRKKNLVTAFVFNVFQKQSQENRYRRSLDNLVELVKDLKIPTARDE